jgi:hypothetical protein
LGADALALLCRAADGQSRGFSFPSPHQRDAAYILQPDWGGQWNPCDHFGTGVANDFNRRRLAGFGLAAVFPTTFALFTQRCGAEATRIAGMLFVLASLGGAVIPWLVGWTSDFYENLRIGLIVPLLGSLLMIALQGAIILDFSFTRRGV